MISYDNDFLIFIIISYLKEQEVDFQLLLNLNNNDFLFKGARIRFPVNSQFK